MTGFIVFISLLTFLSVVELILAIVLIVEDSNNCRFFNFMTNLFKENLYFIKFLKKKKECLFFGNEDFFEKNIDNIIGAFLNNPYKVEKSSELYGFTFFLDENKFFYFHQMFGGVYFLYIDCKNKKQATYIDARPSFKIIIKFNDFYNNKIRACGKQEMYFNICKKDANKRMMEIE